MPKERKVPQEEQDIKEFLFAAQREFDVGVGMRVKITLKWLFEQLKASGALDQDKIYAIHEALTKVCQHDKHIHDGSICWTCGAFWE